MKQSLVTRKNRKLRKLRELYPDVRVKLFYERDFERIASRYGCGVRRNAASRAPERTRRADSPLTRDGRIGEVYLGAAEIAARVRRARRRDRARLRRTASRCSSARSRRASRSSPTSRGRCRSRTRSTSSSWPATARAEMGGHERIRFLKDLDLEIAGRDVVIVDEVVDTGLTLHYLCRALVAPQARVARLRDALRPPVPPARRRPPDPLRRLHRPGRVLRRLRLRPRRALAQPARPAPRPRAVAGRPAQVLATAKLWSDVDRRPPASEPLPAGLQTVDEALHRTRFRLAAVPRAGVHRVRRLHRPGQLRDQHRRRLEVRLHARLGDRRLEPDGDADPDAVGEARHRDRQEPARGLPRPVLAPHVVPALGAGRGDRDGDRPGRVPRRRDRLPPAARDEPVRLDGPHRRSPPSRSSACSASASARSRR